MHKVALFAAVMALILGTVVVWAGTSSAVDPVAVSTYDVGPITNAI